MNERRPGMRKLLFAALLLCLALPLLLVGNLNLQLQPQRRRPAVSSPPPVAFTLDRRAFCSGGTCFHRLGLCISASQVRVCHGSATALPRMLRFEGERLTLPLVRGDCGGGSGRWINGTTMLADQRFLPYHKPNPHHEAEKLIPATLLAHHLLAEGTNMTSNKKLLYWFAAPGDVSDWAKGFLRAVDMEDKVEYLGLPTHPQEPVCFEDAILFSPPTDVRYVPSPVYNSWLRNKVLGYCSLPILNASASVAPSRVLVLDRSGTRHLANKREIVQLVRRTLKVSVVTDLAGTGSFCDQVSKVATEDFVIVPHGSQNVNLLFAVPGTQVIEVFPHLFHSDALTNYTHAAQVDIHPLLGALPPHSFTMRLWSLLGWDVCYHWVRWCKNYARQQPIYADLGRLQALLESLAGKYKKKPIN